MKSISFVLLLACILCTSSAFAHAIWIESAPLGTKGKNHVVKVYYGEYEHSLIEKTSDWYSDLNKLELFLVQPNQPATKLTLTDKGTYLEASFVPASEGAYTIYTSHITKELWEEKRFQFSSAVSVQIGKITKTPEIASAYNLHTPAEKHVKDSKVTTTLTIKGKALAEKEVTVMAPDGWVRKITTDASGAVSFKASLAGIYIIEYGENEEGGGIWDGKPYKETWQTVTTTLLVK